MKNIFLLVVFVFFIQNILAQNIAPYKEGKFWGLKDIDKNLIVVPAKFLKCRQIVDNYFIVMTKINNERLTGIINENGDTIINFGYNFLSVKPCESEINYCFYEHSSGVYYSENSKYMRGNHIYLIDKERNCIPTEYHPCPSWNNKIDTPLEYLKIIQLGEKYFTENKVDSAIHAYQSSIDLNPKNPFPYYWGANKLLYENYHGISYKKNASFSKYNHIIEKWLKSADSLESNPSRKLEILELRYNYYRFHENNKNKRKELFKNARELDPGINRIGTFLITGLEYSFDPFVEVGIGKGAFSSYSDFLSFNSFGMVYFGVSYLKNLKSNIDALKLYTYSVFSPVRVGLCFFGYTDYNDFSFVPRPEIGLSFKNITFSYGYNLYFKKSFINDKSNNVFTVRFPIPISTYISFDFQKETIYY